MTCYSKPTFPLLKLPYLPFDLIIKQMKIGEIMLLSICSKRLAYWIKIGKHVIHYLHVHLKPGGLQVRVVRNEQDYCDFFLNSTENGAIVSKECDSLAKWFKNGNSEVLNFTSTGSIKDLFSVCNRLRSDFRVTYYFWRIHLEEFKNRNLKEMISTLDFDICTRLYMVGGKVDTSTLSFLINRMDCKNRLAVTCKIPYSFKHPRALDFLEVYYEDARWLKVNDLKKIRNDTWVDLIGRSNFDNHDINELIKYWTECKEKMFAILRIKLKDGIPLNMNRILKGVISYQSWGQHFYLSKTQTHSVGCVEYADSIITLKAYPFESLQHYKLVPVLKLLEQQSDLNMSYSKLIKKERELHARIENEEEQYEFDQEIRKVETEKRNVETEFHETITKLRHYRVPNINPHLEHVA